MRKAIKNSLLGIFYILVLPFGLSAKLVHVTIKSPRLFHLFAEAFSLLPGYPGMCVRACYYQQTLEKAHLDMDVAFGGRFSKLEARVGRGVIIAASATVGCADIGDGSVIGNRVSVLSGRRQHNFDDPNRGILDGTDLYSRITIGKNVFVGDHSVVMADIGDHTIVGAGSIIVKELPAYVVAVGNPAKVIRERKRTSSQIETDSKVTNQPHK